MRYELVELEVVEGEILACQVPENLIELLVVGLPVLLVDLQQLRFYLLLDVGGHDATGACPALGRPVSLDDILEMDEYLLLGLKVVGLREDRHKEQCELGEGLTVCDVLVGSPDQFLLGHWIN